MNRNDELTQKLIEQGLIMKAGWIGYEAACVPVLASETQRKETEVAFYAGALHLFTSIMSGAFDENAEPSKEDEARLTNIQRELDEFQIRLLELFPQLRNRV